MGLSFPCNCTAFYGTVVRIAVMMTRLKTFLSIQPWITIGLFFLAACALMEFEPDSWWSLRAGQDFFAGKDLFHDSWTWRAEGNYWPNHEVVWEILTYSLYKIAGDGYFLLILFCALNLTVPLIMSTTTKSAGNKSIERSAYLLVFALPYLYYFAQARALTASLALFSICLWLIRRERYFYLPLAIFVWANLHGAFIMGCVVIFVAFLLKVGEYAKTKDYVIRKQVGEIFLVGLASFAVSFVNPLGWRLWQYVVQAPLKTTGQVAEWLPLSSFPSQLGVTLVMVLMVLVGLVRKRSESSWETISSTIMFFVTTLLAIFASRNFMFMLVAALPLLHLLTESSPPPKLTSVRQQKLMPVAALIVLLLSVIVSIQGAASKSYVFSPEALAAYKACPGKQWNDYSSGGALVWFAPEVKAFQDNRYDYFDEEMVENLAFFPGMNWKAYMDDLEISCMFIKKTELSYPVVAADEAGVWVKSFEDKVYSQWVRAEK